VPRRRQGRQPFSFRRRPPFTFNNGRAILGSVTETLATHPRRRRRAPARRGAALAAFVAVSVLATACGNGQYRYVTDSHPNLEYLVSIPNRASVPLTVKAASTYVRLPVSWHVFSHIDYLVHAGVGSMPPDKQFDTAHKFLFTPFDGNISPTLDNVDKQDGVRPSGMEEIVVLDDQQRDSFSLSTIRNFSIKYDQAQSDAKTNATTPSVRIISQNPALVRSGGYHGSEIVYSVNETDGSTQTIDQVAMIDAATRVLYVLSIGCEAHCFTAYQPTIRAVVQSWTIK
jgi:hypothetical protein